MVDKQVGNLIGVTAKDDNKFAADTDFDSVANLKARLQVIDATYYTNELLNKLTYNDLVYAVRLADHAGSF